MDVVYCMGVVTLTLTKQHHTPSAEINRITIHRLSLLCSFEHLPLSLATDQTIFYLIEQNCIDRSLSPRRAVPIIMSTSAGEDAQQESIVTSNGKSKGGSPTVLPHKPLSAKESGAYDHLEASESFRYLDLDDTCCGKKNNRKLQMYLQSI